jgi:hypothetical protein
VKSKCNFDFKFKDVEQIVDFGMKKANDVA